MNIIYIAIIIIITILVIFQIYFSYTHVSFKNKFVEGLWIGDDNFCQKADIGGMILYLENGQAYLVMHDDNKILISKSLDCKFVPGFYSFLPSNKYYGTIYINDEEGVMPRIMQAEVDLINGKMVWTGEDGVVYANLCKDNISLP